MPPSDAIRRLSDELARDPASPAYLPLARLLAESGRADAALRIARQGAARHEGASEARELVSRLEARREAAPASPAPTPGDGARSGGDDATDAPLCELLVSPHAVLAAGWEPSARDRAAAVAAELGAMAEQADRALAHLALGSWRRVVVEGDSAVVALAPAHDGLVAVAVPIGAPLGRLAPLLRQARERFAAWRERSS